MEPERAVRPERRELAAVRVATAASTCARPAGRSASSRPATGSTSTRTACASTRSTTAPSTSPRMRRGGCAPSARGRPPTPQRQHADVPSLRRAGRRRPGRVARACSRCASSRRPNARPPPASATTTTSATAIFHEVRTYVDVDPDDITRAWLHGNPNTVFGVEVARAATIRYLNLGLSPGAAATRGADRGRRRPGGPVHGLPPLRRRARHPRRRARLQRPRRITAPGARCAAARARSTGTRSRSCTNS